MALRRIGPFTRGIVGDSGFSGGGAIELGTMQDVVIDREGRIARRGGSDDTIGVDRNSTVTMLKRVYFSSDSVANTSNVYGSATVGKTLALELDTTPLYWINGTTWNEVQNNSYSAAESVRIAHRVQLYPPVVVYNGRVFIGLATNNRFHFTWADNTSLASNKCYSVGHAAPAAAPSLAASAGGSLGDGSWYGVAYTYYNSTYGIETIASSAATVQTSGANLSISCTLTEIVDAGFDKYRVYRTLPQTTSALAAAAALNLVGSAAMTTGSSTEVRIDTGALINSVAYTLDTATTTLLIADNDVFDDIPIFMCVSDDTVWAIVGARTLRWCKRTATATYPDAWPTENEIDIGSSSDEVHGLFVNPTGEGMLAFTARSIISITGTGLEDVRQVKLFDVGCPWPRSIVEHQDMLVFLGNDNQVWFTNGATVFPISRSVNHLLSGIPAYQRWLPVATIYGGQYWLSFSSQTPVVSSSASTTVAAQTATPMTVTAASRITDGAAWDLSAVKPGMYIERNTSPNTDFGWITAVSDASDYVDVQGASTITSDVIYDVIVNDRILVYDFKFGYWREMRGPGMQAFMWWYGDTGELYGATSRGHTNAATGAVNGFVFQLDTTNSTDAAGTTATSAITSLVKTIPITGATLGQPGKLWRPIGVFIYPDGTATSVTVNAYKDNGASADCTQSDTVAASANWRIGLSPTSWGHTWEIEITGTAMMSIAEVYMEYEVSA